jgi:hypothetical protein
MHPYRPHWQYGYAFPAGSAEANHAYAASYYQMYAGVQPTQPVASHHIPETVAATATPAYTSDFSSGTSGFSLAPAAVSAAAAQQSYQKRPRYQAPTNQNLQQVPLTEQPPPPPRVAPKAGKLTLTLNLNLLVNNLTNISMSAKKYPGLSLNLSVPIFLQNGLGLSFGWEKLRKLIQRRKL